MAYASPGEGGIPYTHREVFLASPHLVGQGLSTFSEASYPDLEDKPDLESIVDDDSTWHTVIDDHKIWPALLKSRYLREIRHSRVAAEYIAQNTSNDIRVKTYQDIPDLINYSNISSLSRDDIAVILSVSLSHGRVWSNERMFNKLVKNHANWASYYEALTSRGNPSDKLSDSAIGQIGCWAVDNHGRDLEAVFVSQSNVDGLLSQDNKLNESYPEIDTDLPSAVQAQNMNSNLMTASSYGSLNGFKSSPYTNRRGLGILENCSELRRVIARSRLGIADEDFTFEKLLAGDYSVSFFDAINQLDDELIDNDSKAIDDKWKVSASISYDSSSGYFELVSDQEGSVHHQVEAVLSLNKFPVENHDELIIETSYGIRHDINTEVRDLSGTIQYAPGEAISLHGSHKNKTHTFSLAEISELELRFAGDTNDYYNEADRIRIHSIELR